MKYDGIGQACSSHRQLLWFWLNLFLNSSNSKKNRETVTLSEYVKSWADLSFKKKTFSSSSPSGAFLSVVEDACVWVETETYCPVDLFPVNSGGGSSELLKQNTFLIFLPQPKNINFRTLFLPGASFDEDWFGLGTNYHLILITKYKYTNTGTNTNTNTNTSLLISIVAFGRFRLGTNSLLHR